MLKKRYKRFLADIVLPDQSVLTIHCPNSGSMKSCLGENWRVAYSDSHNPKRKYPHTFEMIHNGQGWIGINTHRANDIVAEGIAGGAIPELAGYDNLLREQKYGKNSRIDILLQKNTEKCYVEIKNVTLLCEDGNYAFPDAVTERGRKHLYELIEMARAGHRAVMFFLVQRSDGEIFRPAVEIDPDYAMALKKAAVNGVEVLVYQATVSPEQIGIAKKIDFNL
jgi:sugar fermentation stimulation protein A